MNAHSNPQQTITDLRQRQLPKIFYPSAVDYLYPMDGATAEPDGRNAYLPIEVDTEYYHPRLDFKRFHQQLSPTITVQCRAIVLDTGKIFAHPDITALARHPLFDTGFVVVDYLRALGYQIELEPSTPSDLVLPWIQVDLYAFFAVAELLRVVRGTYRQDIIDLTLDAESKGRGIVQGRRLRTFTKIRGDYLPWVLMPWAMTINGVKYAVRLAWYDTCAVHGATSYAGFCHNTGVEIPYKDLFTSAEKAEMLSMYTQRPEEYDQYGLGDLYNCRGLVKNVSLFRTIYTAIDLGDFFRPPRLTTGATVRDLIEAVIGRMCATVHPKVKLRILVNAYCKYGTAAELKKRVTTTAAYNAKVDGGRCRNNRPTDTVARGVLCDLDISGCYGEGLRVQLYPLGVPVILDYPLDSNSNSYLTLSEFRRRYDQELVPGLWQARVSTPLGYRLKYPQDFLSSWFPPRDLSQLPTDTQLAETDEWWSDDNAGLLKVLTHQINLALVNHDVVQWIDKISSVRQRKELLENLRVVTALYYPASDRVGSVEELRAAHDQHLGRNTCTVKKIRGQTTKIVVEQECHTWYAETLGEAVITRLQKERQKHPKKTPLNELFKLNINTTYGDMVSPYFGIGNVVVGNNITARARALAWYMEKGLHGWQTITDGCAFDVNHVLHPGKVRVNGESVVGLYRQDLRNSNLEIKPLAGYGQISLQPYPDSKAGLILSNKAQSLSAQDLVGSGNDPTASGEGITELDPSSAMNWMNRAAMEHLQNLFPGVDVLHCNTTDLKGNQRQGQFGFEAKGLYESASFQGTANYCFTRCGEVVEVKMRSYSKKPQATVSDLDFTVSDESFYPARHFLTSLLDNPTHIARQPVFLKPSILKVGDFSRHYYHRYKESKVFPGMTVKQASLLREFSLTQYTYQDLDQYRAWEREAEGLRRRYGQTYEMYFLNPNGTLNYQLMVETIDALIAEGKHGFWDGKDKRSSHGYRLQSPHPALKTLENTRQALASYYGYQGAVKADESELSETNWTDDSEEFHN